MSYRTIIADSNVRNHLFRQLTSDNDVVLSVQVLSLSAFRQSLADSEKDDTRQFTEIYSTLGNNISPDNIYREELKYPVFARYFYDFVSFMIENGIKPADLPDVTQDDICKKEILSYIYHQPLSSHLITEKFNSLTDCSNIQIYPGFQKDLARQRQLDFLIARGATCFSVEKTANRSTQVFFSKNKTKEITSIAQYIVDRQGSLDLDKTVIMVNDPASYQPIIRQIFTLYGIPYQDSFEHVSSTAQLFNDLLTLVYRKDIDSFIQSYCSYGFSAVSDDFLQYVKTLNLKYSDLFRPFTYYRNYDFEKYELINQRQYDYYLQQEDLAETERERVTAIISRFPAKGSLKEITSSIYDYLLEILDTEDETIRQDLSAIFTLCLENVPALSEMQSPLAMMNYLLDGIRSVDRTSGGIQICSPYQDIPDKDLAIIVGCSQSVFPQVVNRDGFFDESYLERITSDYPSLLERTEFFNSQLKQLYDSIPEIIYSYPVYDYDGKTMAVSSLLPDKGQPWPYRENDNMQTGTSGLDPITARKLYLKNNDLLNASPSSFEMFNGCAFEYFLSRGLDLQQQDLFAIGANTIGTLQHKILELIYSQDSPFTPQQMQQLVDDCFDQLSNVFINDRANIRAMAHRLVENLMTKFEFLADARNNSAYKPVHHEYRAAAFLKEKDYTLNVHGIIDRVDYNNERFMIVDYKSSRKAISVDSFCRGATIQLLTYLFIYSQNNPQDVPSAMSYLNLKNETLPESAKKDDRQQNYDNSRYLTYRSDPDDKLQAEYYNTTRKDTFDPQIWFPLVRKLYETIAEDILSGKTDIDPKNDQCTFCPYRQICHSRLDSSIKSDYLITPPVKEESEDE